MRFVLCVSLCLCFCSLAEARGRRGYSSGGTSASQSAVVDPAPTYKVEERLVEVVNAERQRNGLGALILDPLLHMRARRHCGWMANARSMVHSVDPGAENIAMGSMAAEEVLNRWLNSSGHRANILNPNYTRIGVAGYLSPDGTPYWCQQFE